MTILKYDIKAIAAGDQSAIYANETDRWDSPSIQIDRPWNDDKPFSFRISHSSSGSRDTNVDAILKAELLRLQLADCIETVQELLTRLDELAAARIEYKVEQRAIYEATVAAKQVKVDADTQLTPSQIGHLIATICVDIKHGGKYRIVKELRERGDTNTHRLIARSTSGGAVQFKLSGQLLSKAKLSAVLVKYAEVLEDTQPQVYAD